MSNIAFITTRKHLKSYDIPSLLSQINDKRFDGKLTIKLVDGGWNVSFLENGLDTGKYGFGFWFHSVSPKKLAVKWPHGPWMTYVFVVFKQELAALTNGVLSDESEPGTYLPTPNKYPSYKSWIELSCSRIKKSPYYDEHLKIEMGYAPKGMEKY